MNSELAQAVNKVGAHLHSIRELARALLARIPDDDLGALAHSIEVLAEVAVGECETLEREEFAVMHSERPGGGVLCQPSPVPPSVNRTALRKQVTCPSCLRLLDDAAP